MKNKNLSFLSWNTAKRIKYLDEQTKLIKKTECDVIALQEITKSSDLKYKKSLNNIYENIISSFDLAKDTTILKGKRMFGQLIASKFPISAIDPKKINVPWQERVLSVKLENNIYLHTTHIPPGSSNGWIKVKMINGIVKYLIKNKIKRQILCGDFNTPKFESKETGLVTFAQNIKKDNKVVTKGSFRGGKGKDWDNSERSLFSDLKKNNIFESYRIIYPKRYSDKSWIFKRKEKIFGQRFDHFFASDNLKVEQVKYLKIEKGISDHLPLKVVYRI